MIRNIMQHNTWRRGHLLSHGLHHHLGSLHRSVHLLHGARVEGHVLCDRSLGRAVVAVVGAV